jgi:hypothetical protein
VANAVSNGMANPTSPTSRLANLDKILDEIDKKRVEASRKQLNFTGVDQEQLFRKLLRVNSPMIVFQSWNGSAAQGGRIDYQFGVLNPDPTNWVWLYGYGYVGPSNFMRDIGKGVAARDQRFADMTTPSFPGQSIAPSSTVTLTMSLTIPRTIEKTTYQGNTVLFQADWHDTGLYLDRGLWTFDVT